MSRELEKFKGNVKIIENVCEFRGGARKNFHHLKVGHNGQLEWVDTIGEIGGLEKYRLPSKTSIPESELVDLENGTKLAIICGDPGMGKTTLVKHLKNNLSESVWKIIVCPKEHSPYFQSAGPGDLGENFLRYIFHQVGATRGSWEEKMLAAFAHEGRVVLFWDGMEEVGADDLEVVTNIIGQISKRDIKQFVTARHSLTKRLETRLGALARNIMPFDHDEQKDYIHNRLRCPKSETERVVGKILDFVGAVQYNAILGIPLQIAMLVELFNEDCHKYDNVFSVSKLYEHCIDEKLNICWKKFCADNSPGGLSKRFVDAFKETQLACYEKAALKLFLDEAVLATLQLECSEFLEKLKTDNFIDGIITGVTKDGKPNFLHQSFADYFAAKYFVAHHHLVPDFAKIIFEERMLNVRFLFDLLSAGTSLPHLAVLYSNPEILHKCRSQMNRADSAGRSPLHLASSWARRYPIPSCRHEKVPFWTDKNYMLHNLVDNFSAGETEHFREIWTVLVETCNPHQKDLVHNLNVFCYADRSSCLFPIADLAKKYKIRFENFTNFDIPTIAYYSIKFGYERLLTRIGRIPSATVLEPGSFGKWTFVHVAASQKNANILKYLLKSRRFRKKVNEADHFGVTALHISSANGFGGVVQLLLKHGADANAADIYDETPIHNASSRGHCEVVKLLLKHKADVNVANLEGDTPLHVASAERHCDIVKVLLENDADVNITNRYEETASLAKCFK